jgi:hypothetical protein
MLGDVEITLSSLIVETLDKAGVDDFVYPLAVFVRCADGAEVARVYTEEGAQQTGGHQKMEFPAVVRLTDGTGRTWHAALDEKGKPF